MILDPTNFFQQINIPLIIKIIFLILIGLYSIFSLMLANKVRSFNKILFLPPNGGGGLMQTLALVYSVTIVIFFLLALIML